MLRVKSHQFAATTPAFNLLHLHVALRFSASENEQHPTFSHFSRKPTCDRQTDGQTDRSMTTANSHTSLLKRCSSQDIKNFV